MPGQPKSVILTTALQQNLLFSVFLVFDEQLYGFIVDTSCAVFDSEIEAVDFIGKRFKGGIIYQQGLWEVNELVDRFHLYPSETNKM